MGNGNFEVGKRTATRKSSQPVERVSGSNGSAEPRIDSPLKPERPFGGAMSQQSGEFLGNVSSPQKFVHLVGCREPKVIRDAGMRPYANPAKR